uniref:Uncharacterized protein n=1 Tax=Musa acuminata subsp. malaccensis TaxID=214687 RepID=A0A804IR44_MUSAM
MESSLWLLLSLGVSVLSLLLLSRAAKRSSKSGGHQLPPGPTPLPVVGNLFELGDKPHRSLARLAKLYSPVMTLRLGRVTTVFVSSPEMAGEILQKNDAVLSSRWIPEAVRVLDQSEASMVWLPPCQRWRKLRRICKTQLFTAERLDSYQSLRREKVQELMQYISDSTSKGLLVHVGHVAFSTTLNLISRTVFSVDLVDLYAESAQEFKQVVEGITEEAGRANLSDYFPLLAKLDPQAKRKVHPTPIRLTDHQRPITSRTPKRTNSLFGFNPTTPRGVRGEGARGRGPAPHSRARRAPQGPSPKLTWGRCRGPRVGTGKAPDSGHHEAEEEAAEGGGTEEGMSRYGMITLMERSRVSG